jgi:hypothetical protein
MTARASEALARSEALFLAPCRRPDGNFSVMVIAEDGKLVRDVALPARGHDLAVDAERGRAVAFARRPGTFAIAFEVAGERPPQAFVARPDRHFFGHGAFSRDGKLLYATENDIATDQGVIGIYDTTAGYRRVGELSTYGIGPHEAILMPDGKTLAVANGGIETNPTFGRQMLNLPTMEPSLVFVEAETGQLVAKHSLGPEQHYLSIRHMAVGSDGGLWFGTQWEGDPLQTPSLVGRASLDGGLRLVETPETELAAMRSYVGAMAASRDGSIITASAPRGGLLAHFSAETGKLVGTTAIVDSSGVAGYGAKTILASNGAGLIVETDCEGAAHTRTDMPGVAFDNHLRVFGAPGSA